MRYAWTLALPLTIAILSCHNAGQNNKAYWAANQALYTYSRNSSNPDSTHRALYLLDSLNKLHPYLLCYLFKYQILRETNQPQAALLACDSTLQLDPQNYFATLGKGYAFELIGKQDSACFYYTIALGLVNNPHCFTALEVVKDHERIVLTALLKDTVAFKQLVVNFNAKYRDTTNDLYNSYRDEFKRFRRDDYVETGAFVARDSEQAILDTAK